MYRKDKIGIAVDNYKRKQDSENSDAGSDTVSESDSESMPPSQIREKENEQLSTSNEIKSVAVAKSITNKDDNNQVAGFNLFLQQIQKSKQQSNQNSQSNEDSNRSRAFQLIKPGERFVSPSVYTVTSINQTKDLQRLGNQNGPVNVIEQSSEEWLLNHGLDTLNLSIDDLIRKGKIGDPRPDEESGEAVNFLIYDEYDVNEFEYGVHMAIEAYSKRIKWYLQGSRKMFGLVGGQNVCVLLDSSDANLGFGRMILLQDDLLHLLQEQLTKKQSLQVGYIGSDIKWLWQSGPKQLSNCRVIEEVKQGLGNLVQLGGCNLLLALKQVMKDKSIDKVVLIMGSNQDQDSDILLDYFQQLSLGRDLPSFHCVAYETDNAETTKLLRQIAYLSGPGGSYHRYSSMTEELIYTSNDIELLLQEIEKAQELLTKISLMRQGLFNDKISPAVHEIAREINSLPQSEFLPQPPSFHDDLKFEEASKFQPKTSAQWLYCSGLKAKKLDLYGRRNKYGTFRQRPIPVRTKKPCLGGKNNFRSQAHSSLYQEGEKTHIERLTELVLNPNAYSSQAEYVPSIKKLVTSSVYEKAMIQVEWPDGGMRNVHADLTQLFEYQKLLGEQVKLMEQRINWLASGSRRLFGTIIESSVVFVLDLSLSNLKYLVHIQHSLKILIQQQLLSHKKFNFVAFNTEIIQFKDGLVPVTKANLEAAWVWIKGLQCGGSRNFMGALKAVLENPIDQSHNDSPEGIYLFTSGVPDQHIDPLLSYLEERLIGTNSQLHTVLFNVDDYDKSGAPIPSRYANITKTAEIMRLLAHQTQGRFHWFRESGIIESDDIRVLMAEIDMAVEYSQRTQKIIQDFKDKYPDSRFKKAENIKIQKQAAIMCRRESSDNLIALPPPRPTSLSKARQQIATINRKQQENPAQIKNSAKTSHLHSMGDPMKSATKGEGRAPRIASAFYTENGNTKGVVYKNSGQPESGTVRKGIGKTEIPNKEEWISSQSWLKKYSLKNMGLNLLKLVSGPDCRHEESFVVPIEKFAEAKYCIGLFPIVNVKGTRKHMQFTPTELYRYDVEAKKALERYLKRLDWLMTGSRRIFGVIVEPAVTILLDTSGSMIPHMPELIQNLKTLIWEQLFKRKIRFNLVAFNSEIFKFRDCLVDPNEVNCHSAVGWVEQLTAHGSTDTLEIMRVTLDEGSCELKAVYMLTDGKPDCSTDAVLQFVKSEKSKRSLPIHTISFNCEDVTANQFLMDLSRTTGGRYHKVCHEYDVRLFTQRVADQCNQTIPKKVTINDVPTTQSATEQLSVDPYYPVLPQFEGDDLQRIAKEIQLTRVNVSKTNYFRELYAEMIKMKQEQQQKSSQNAKLAREQLSKRLVY